jgi:hypothetical protein
VPVLLADGESAADSDRLQAASMFDFEHHRVLAGLLRRDDSS